MNTNTIDGKILHARTAISNSQNVPEIQAALTPVGYTAETLEAGSELVTEADRLHSIQKQEYGDQFAATDSLNEAKEAANTNYKRHLKLARVALRKDRGAAEALQLSGERKEATASWVQQARAFYTNALASAGVKATLAEVGITQQVLEAGKAAVELVEERLAIQRKEMGAAQAATEARDHALDDLQEWMTRFVPIAQVALEDNPQLMEALGIKPGQSNGSGSTPQPEEETGPQT